MGRRASGCVVVVRRRRFDRSNTVPPKQGLSPKIPHTPKFCPENSASRNYRRPEKAPEFTRRLVDHRDNHHVHLRQCRRNEARTTALRRGNREASRIRMRGLFLRTSWRLGRGPSFCLRFLRSGASFAWLLDLVDIQAPPAPSPGSSCLGLCLFFGGLRLGG
jgi:hypothetical protein